MDRRYFDEGMGCISRYFAKPYKVENINAIWPDVRDYPNEAMNAAHKRVEVEYHASQLVAIGKIKDLIIIEGRKIQGKEAVEREQEAERQKREYRTLGQVQGLSEYEKDCLAAVRTMMDPDIDEIPKLTAIIHLERKYPGKGWREKYNLVFKDWHRQGLIKSEDLKRVA